MGGRVVWMAVVGGGREGGIVWMAVVGSGQEGG